MTSAKVTTPHIANLLTAAEEYPAPRIVADSARQQRFAEEYTRSIAAPEEFWGGYARQFMWTSPWTRVLSFDGVHHQWFVGARTNITLNALDRHANSSRANRAAYIWLGEDGTERLVTYRQLHRMVCRLANGLKSLGVRKGDRVIIYMPLTIEGVASMLACALSS